MINAWESLIFPFHEGYPLSDLDEEYKFFSFFKYHYYYALRMGTYWEVYLQTSVRSSQHLLFRLKYTCGLICSLQTGNAILPFEILTP